jgi:hypothetical protein
MKHDPLEGSNLAFYEDGHKKLLYPVADAPRRTKPDFFREFPYNIIAEHAPFVNHGLLKIRGKRSVSVTVQPSEEIGICRSGNRQ